MYRIDLSHDLFQRLVKIRSNRAILDSSVTKMG